MIDSPTLWTTGTTHLDEPIPTRRKDSHHACCEGAEMHVSWSHPTTVTPRDDPRVGFLWHAIGVKASANLRPIDADAKVDDAISPASHLDRAAHAGRQFADVPSPIDDVHEPPARSAHRAEVILVYAIAVFVGGGHWSYTHSNSVSPGASMGFGLSTSNAISHVIAAARSRRTMLTRYGTASR